MSQGVKKGQIFSKSFFFTESHVYLNNYANEQDCKIAKW